MHSSALATSQKWWLICFFIRIFFLLPWYHNDFYVVLIGIKKFILQFEALFYPLLLSGDSLNSSWISLILSQCLLFCYWGFPVFFSFHLSSFHLTYQVFQIHYSCLYFHLYLSHFCSHILLHFTGSAFHCSLNFLGILCSSILNSLSER